jgi:hypothetical protein
VKHTDFEAQESKIYLGDFTILCLLCTSSSSEVISVCGGGAKKMTRNCVFLWVRKKSTDDAHGGAAKVPIWQDPTSPSKWKDEHVSFFFLGFFLLLSSSPDL